MSRVQMMATLLLLAAGCTHLKMATTRPAALPPLPSAVAQRAAMTPKLSADPDDPAWQIPPAIDHLTLPLRYTTDQPIYPTQVRLLWDADNLYVRFTTTGPEPYSPMGDKHDEKQYLGDAVEVFLDPVGDGRQYFEIQISAANGVLDQNTLVTAKPEFDEDRALTKKLLATEYWPNLGYDIKGLRTATRIIGGAETRTWITDVAIPTIALRRTGKAKFEPMTLRMNFMRYHWTGPVEQKDRVLIPQNWGAVRFGCPHQSPAAMGFVELK